MKHLLKSLALAGCLMVLAKNNVVRAQVADSLERPVSENSPVKADLPEDAIHRFSLDEALQYGQQHNTQVKNALLDILIQEQSNRQVAAAALPSVTASGSVTDNLKLQTVLLPGEFMQQPAGTFVPVTFGTTYNTTAGVDANQVLFDGQVFIGLKARRTSMDWKKAQADVTKENIRTNIYKIYYQLVVSRTQMGLIQANIDRISKLKHDTQLMYENGVAEKLDIDKSDVQLTNLETEKQKLLVTIANGYNGLKILLGMPISDKLILTDSLSEDQIKSGILVGNDFNYNQRNDYKALQLSRKLDAFNVKRYKYSKLPTLNLAASYSKQNQQNDLSFSGDWFTSSFISLRLNIPLFSGFSKNAQIKQAGFELLKADNQLFNLRQTIDNEIQTAKNNFGSAISIMDYQKKNMELAQKVYDQTKKKYEVGAGSQTEINTAQTDLKAAQTNYISALYDAVIAKVDFLKATGKL